MTARREQREPPQYARVRFDIEELEREYHVARAVPGQGWLSLCGAEDRLGDWREVDSSTGVMAISCAACYAAADKPGGRTRFALYPAPSYARTVAALPQEIPRERREEIAKTLTTSRIRFFQQSASIIRLAAEAVVDSVTRAAVMKEMSDKAAAE